MGLPIGDQTIHNLFVDDMVIIAWDKEDAEYMTEELIMNIGDGVSV
jgi:hypothetical protein